MAIDNKLSKSNIEKAERVINVVLRVCGKIYSMSFSDFHTLTTIGVTSDTYDLVREIFYSNNIYTLFDWNRKTIHLATKPNEFVEKLVIEEITNVEDFVIEKITENTFLKTTNSNSSKFIEISFKPLYDGAFFSIVGMNKEYVIYTTLMTLNKYHIAIKSFEVDWEFLNLKVTLK